MTNHIASAKAEFAELLLYAAGRAFSDIALVMDDARNSIAIPEQSRGDLSSSLAFKLSKMVKKSPHDVALAMIAELRPGHVVQRFTEANGYVNAFFDEREYGKRVIESAMSETSGYGSGRMGKNETVLIEFPAVNPAHPWHVGHLRNALLGDAVSNLFTACGYNVEREDYIDDLGLQATQAFWGYSRFPDKEREGKTKFDLFLGEKYVEANKVAEDPENAASMKALLKSVEETGTKEAQQARKISERCVHAQYETAFEFGIYHDVMIWESDIVGAKLLDAALKLAKETGAVEMGKDAYANCVVLDLTRVKDVAKEFENPIEKYKVLIRSNGVATYAMKDFAFHLWKFGVAQANFKYSAFIESQPNGKTVFTTSGSGEGKSFGDAKKVINVIDMSQAHEQATVRALLKLTGNKEACDNLVHLAYGKVSLKEGSISGRKGGWLGSERNYTADDLLTETAARALEITKNSKKISSTDFASVARSVALSAIKFEYLRVAPEKAMVFSWESALNFEANSGPYVMYMYVRARKILERGGYSPHTPAAADYALLQRGDEFEMVKAIGRLPDVIETACRECRPNTVAEYLLDLSSLFSKFYESSPVLTGGESKGMRSAIVWATMQAIGNALSILGITPLEAM